MPETTTTEPPSPLQIAADACRQGQVDGDLHLHNWPDYIDPDLITAFEETTGVAVTETFFDSNEALFADVSRARAVYDVAVPSDYMVTDLATAGLLVRLNRDALASHRNIDRAFRGLAFDPDGEYSVPYLWGTTGLGFDRESIEDQTDLTWGLIFDPDLGEEFAGSISMLNDERESLGAALQYLGHSVNTTDPILIREASDVIAASIGRILTFESDDFDDLLVSGESRLAHGWNGDFAAAFDASENGGEYGYGLPTEGGIGWIDNMVIPVTAEAPCTAHAFIDFMLEPDKAGALTNFTHFASPNRPAEAFIKERLLEDERVYPPDRVFERLEFLESGGDAAALYAEAWEQARS